MTLLSDVLLDRAKQLAGDLYTEMQSCKEVALANLMASNFKHREAAVILCDVVWNYGKDQRVIIACLSIIESADKEEQRIAAAIMLGRLLSGSRNPSSTRCLAGLVMNPRSSGRLQLGAYWALRDIWFGQDDPDLLKGIAGVAKSVLREKPGVFSETQIRGAITPEPGFSKGFWEDADVIDWDFVARCQSEA